MAERSDLEAAATAGDAEADFALGRKLLAEASTFEAFDRACALIDSAAGRDHPEATCLLATMAAVGAGRARDWERALDLLVLAAERGSEHARGQLALLGGGGGDWAAMRGRVDLQRLLEAPAAVAISERPRLRRFDRFASPDECGWVIERLRPKLHRAAIWDQVTGEGVVDPYRSNSAAELVLADMDVVIEVLRARISAATRLPEFIFEIPQLMHYKVGEEFRPHHDYLDPQSPGLAADFARRGQRMGTFLLYLNDDFDGGETEFPRAGLSFRGGTGDALFFANVTRDGQPDPMTLHAGRSPTKGEKWILSQWIRERPPVEAAAG